MYPRFLFLVLDLEKIIFLCFLCHAKKKTVILYLNCLSNASLLWKSQAFLCSGYVSQHVQSFKGFGYNLLKLQFFKDKSLARISYLQHIHREIRPISSAFNARQK